MFERLALLDMITDEILLRDLIGGDECANVATDHVVRGEPQQTLGTAVPGQDRAVEVLGHDRVLRGFDDREAYRGFPLQFPIRSFQPAMAAAEDRVDLRA